MLPFSGGVMGRNFFLIAKENKKREISKSS
jgi:hypothetical protein